MSQKKALGLVIIQSLSDLMGHGASCGMGKIYLKFLLRTIMESRQ